MSDVPSPRAVTLLNGLGERATPARITVLDRLLASQSALSHADLAAAAQADGMELDRVTLYRVLDWLVDKGLAHKVLGEDRAWRFNAVATPAAPHEHAHFHCDRCGRLYCLDQLQPLFAFSLPPGFVCRHAELTLHGVCPDCQRTS